MLYPIVHLALLKEKIKWCVLKKWRNDDWFSCSTNSQTPNLNQACSHLNRSLFFYHLLILFAHFASYLHVILICLLRLVCGEQLRVIQRFMLHTSLGVLGLLIILGVCFMLWIMCKDELLDHIYHTWPLAYIWTQRRLADLTILYVLLG